LKAQFDQQLVSSFYLWFENKLLDPSIQAYQTGVSNSYQYINAFDISSDFNAYQGQYRQLVADYDVDVPNSGVFVNGSFITGGSPNVYTDYNNGRIIFPASSGKALNVSSVSTVKEVNTYLTNDSPEQILLESDFFVDGNSVPKASQSTKKLDEKSYWLPACFVFPATSDNEEFAFGGEEETQTRIRVMVLAKDNFTIDAVLSAFRDRARSCIPLIEFENFPYGAFFSVKNHPYRYAVLAAEATETSFVQKVTASRIGKTAEQEKKDKKFQIGFLDFDISTYRFPRS
jgi:hypothetical protein